MVHSRTGRGGCGEHRVDERGLDRVIGLAGSYLPVVLGDRPFNGLSRACTVEVLDSISRVAGAVTAPEQRAAAVGLRRLLAAEREVKDLVEIGAYVPGTNPDADRALALSAEIRGFLCQDMDDVAPAAESWARLGHLVGMNVAGGTE